MREHKSAMLFTKYRLMATLPEAKTPTRTAKSSIIITLNSNKIFGNNC